MKSKIIQKNGKILYIELNLDEKTRKIASNKVKALLDVGYKPVYEIKTKSGRTINTTGNHPYLVKEVKSDILGIGETSKSSSFNLIKKPSKSSGFDFSSSNLENDFNKLAGLSCGILNKTTENIFSLGNFEKSVKFLSFVTNTLCSDLDNSANVPFESPFGLNSTLNPCCLRNFSNSFLTFSSNKNFILCGNQLEFPFSKLRSELQSCFNMFFCEWCWESCKNFFDRHSCFKHFKNLPNHNSCTFEGWCSTTNFTVRNNKAINFDSHKIKKDNDIFKSFDSKSLRKNRGVYTQALSTEYFRFMANLSNETGSFNWTLSTTTWTNIPPITGSAIAIALLNYTATNNSAEVEILVRVPVDEPGGLKESTVNFRGELASSTL